MARTSLISCLFVASLVTGLTGCAASSGSDVGTSSDELNQADQNGNDVQVLQIWTAARVFPQAPGGWFGPTKADVTLNATDKNVCPVTQSLGNFNGYTNYQVDCTSAFTKAIPFDVDGKPGPALDPISFTVEQRDSDGMAYIDPDYCSTVEVRVIVRDAASAQPSFAGVGFSTSKGASFASKSELQAVGHVTLKNGDAATVYRFVGISTCISSAHNSTSGNMYQTFSFKPYAAFDAAAADGTTTRYRVWEKVSRDFAIGHSWPGSTPVVNAQGFDRQDELLQK